MIYCSSHLQAGELGRLDPTTGKTHHIALGQSSVPHGVIIGPDGIPWITDGGLNAIVRVDPLTEEVRVYPLGNDNFLHLSHIHYPQNLEKYQGRRLNCPSLLPSDPHFVT